MKPIKQELETSELSSQLRKIEQINYKVRTKRHEEVVGATMSSRK